MTERVDRVSVGPYFDNGDPIARDSAVIVCDLLGYKDMVKKWSEGPEQANVLKDVYGALAKSIPLVNDPSGVKWIARMLSDTLVVAYPYLRPVGSFEIGQACWNALHFQLDMVSSGYVLRGGICVGKIHISENLVFPSESLLREWQSVERSSKTPRVVLMDSAVSYLESNGETIPAQHLQHALIRDVDGYYYLNYMWPLLTPIEVDKRKGIVRNHKALIERNMVEHKGDQGIKSKYVWMGNYHNFVCRNSQHFACTEFFVNL